uniref:Uncharacterized protein n=1 Tax=Ciona savignyi TaxID=51511 RepID=H2YQH2_CIOSA
IPPLDWIQLYTAEFLDHADGAEVEQPLAPHEVFPTNFHTPPSLTASGPPESPLQAPVGVIIGTLHSVSDLRSPSCLALDLGNQIGVGVL